MGTQGERQAAAEVLAKAKAKTARVKLCLDGDLLDEHAQLSERLAEAQATDEDTNEPDRAPAIAEEIVALEQAIAEAEVEFVFRGMGRGRWRKMLADHPPTDAMKEDGAEFDVDEFPFEAMAACIVSPTLTVDQLKELNDESLDESQFSQVWNACLRVNLGGVNRPSSEAARAIVQSSRGKSDSPGSLESDGASSLADA